MLIKQISIFVENKKGRMAEITKVLYENKIDIRALSVADTADFGILRIITNDPYKALAALKDAGLTVSMTDVIGVRVKDQPGGLDGALHVLATEGMSIEYIYAFVARTNNDAFAVIKINDDAMCKKAIELLLDKGYELLEESKINSL